jgi:CRP-like cAMP-binding protein
MSQREIPPRGPLDLRDSAVARSRDEAEYGPAWAGADSIHASAAVMDSIERQAQHAKAKRLLAREGDAAPAVLIILEGWARGYKTTSSGDRQITEFLLPGDAVAPLCDGNRHMDYSIDAVTPVRFAAIDQLRLQRVTEAWPSFMAGVAQQQAFRQALLREWLLNIGRRSARERIASLMCEVFLRLRRSGIGEANSCPFPLTQVDIADAVGLTPVHVNRTLQQLRRSGMIKQDKGRLTIPDFGALQRVASLDPHGPLLKHCLSVVAPPDRRMSA